MKNQKNIPSVLAVNFAILCLASSAFGQYEGIYGYGIEVNGNSPTAANSGVNALYALNDGGGSTLLPVGSSATLDQTSWGGGTATAPVLNLGTFNPNAGNTLNLLGGSMLSYQGGGDLVEPNVVMYYAIDPIGTEGNWVGSDVLALNQTGVASTPGNMRWSDESQNVNLLNNLTPGTYVLETFALADSTVGILYENNGGANFGAEFTVVPEPSTMALAVLGGLALLTILRKQSQPV